MAEQTAFFAVVQQPDGTEETELVTISAGELPVIELTDGTRITAVSVAGELPVREAA